MLSILFFLKKLKRTTFTVSKSCDNKTAQFEIPGFPRENLIKRIGGEKENDFSDRIRASWVFNWG